MSRIENHIILGEMEEKKMVTIVVDGKKIPAENLFFLHFWQVTLK